MYLLEYNRYANIVGIVAILAIAFIFSRNKKAISYSLVFKCLSLQSVLAFLMLKVPFVTYGVSCVAYAISMLYASANKGIEFLFGPLASWTGVDFIFAVKILPVIVFFGAFMSLLFYLGIVPRAVQAISFVMRPFLGTSGAETLCAVGNSFLGQTEAPLLIRNYLKDMTKSELLVVMVSGMGTISAAILAIYAQMGVPAVHLLTSSIMAIPSTILIAKILYPETHVPKTLSGAQSDKSIKTGSLLDAISQGTSDGLSLALNVGAMLIAFLALLDLSNAILMSSTYYVFGYSVGLEAIFSCLCFPFAWCLGLSGHELVIGSQLIGTKVVINEMIAYIGLVGSGISERSMALLTYALCGFSNFSCIGIQIGGIGALVPEKRSELSELGLMAVLGGMLANLLSAMIVGLLI